MPPLCLGLARNHHGDASCSVGFWDDQLRMQHLVLAYCGHGDRCVCVPARNVRAFVGTCKVPVGKRDRSRGRQNAVCSSTEGEPSASRGVEQENANLPAHGARCTVRDDFDHVG